MHVQILEMDMVQSPTSVGRDPNACAPVFAGRAEVCDFEIVDLLILDVFEQQGVLDSFAVNSRLLAAAVHVDNDGSAVRP